MNTNESREMYLEVIYRLEQANGVVRSIDIAKEFGYTKPSISRAMGILKKNGYITHSPYGDVSLTEKGREKAVQVYRSHQLLTEFFIKVLNLDPKTAEDDACKIEHVISPKALNAIENHLKK
ncbi:metal-dependent transcriptional regulator [Clostridia bacterium]|nr:metal-dependent transcriptional regulator [Clostridia bacterium]